MGFRIGDIRVDAVADFDKFDLDLAQLLPDADAPALVAAHPWLSPEHIDAAQGLAHLAVQSFVLRSGGRTVLIDSCVGEDKQRPTRAAWHQRKGGGFLGRLAELGVTPARVDCVFCTHLHAGHVGWNTRLHNGRWVPTFPRATYLIGRAEMAHWQAQPQPAFADSVLPVMQAGQVELVEDGHEAACPDTVSVHRSFR